MKLVTRTARAGASELSQSTDIQTAVEACCSTMGRPVGSAEQQLVRKLSFLQRKLLYMCFPDAAALIISTLGDH